MKYLVCVDPRGWEAVVRGAALYLSEGDAVVACVVDERAPRGYALAVEGLLGRRGRRSEEGMASVSETVAAEVLADAATLLGQLRPGLSVGTLLLRGIPEEELVRAARDGRAEAVFVHRGNPGSGETVSVSGVVSGWRRNRPGDLDGFYLEDGTEVRFPPHRAEDVRTVVSEGAPVEVRGERRGGHLHAYSVADPRSGVSVGAHEPPSERGGRRPLGHTARFVVDHAPCDVVVLT